MTGNGVRLSQADFARVYSASIPDGLISIILFYGGDKRSPIPLDIRNVKKISGGGEGPPVTLFTANNEAQTLPLYPDFL